MSLCGLLLLQEFSFQYLCILFWNILFWQSINNYWNASILCHLYLKINSEALNQHCLCFGNQISVQLLENGTDHFISEPLCYNNEALYWQQESLHQHHVRTCHDGECNQGPHSISIQCCSLGILKSGVLTYPRFSLIDGNRVCCGAKKTLVLF